MPEGRFASNTNTPYAMGFIQLFSDATGDHRFRLKADNGAVILTSTAYTTVTEAREGVASLRADAENEGCFERLHGRAGWSYRMRSASGHIIGNGTMYRSVQARETGIASVKRNAPHASAEEWMAEGDDPRAAAHAA